MYVIDLEGVLNLRNRRSQSMSFMYFRVVKSNFKVLPNADIMQFDAKSVQTTKGRDKPAPPRRATALISASKALDAGKINIGVTMPYAAFRRDLTLRSKHPLRRDL